MSTSAARVRGVWALPVLAASPRRSRHNWELAITAFALVASLAAVRFAALLSHPSGVRIAGIVLVGGALAVMLSASAAVRQARLAGTVRIVLVALALYLALRLAGMGAGEPLPWHWGSTARSISAGVNALDGLWPYEGSSPEARTALLGCIAASVPTAAALAFWPSSWRAGGRRLSALALLIGLYATAASNETRGDWELQGLVLLAALACWGWAFRAREGQDWRAALWLLIGSALAVLAAVALASPRPLIDLGAVNPFGTPPTPTSFEWDETYGPLRASTSRETMVQVSSPRRELWRAAVLDRFDGVRFLTSGHPPREPEEPLVQGSWRWVTTASFTVRGLSSRDVLSPGQILSMRISGPSLPGIKAIAPDGTQTLTAAPQAGVRYTVTAYAPRPSAAEMSAAPARVSAALLPYTRFELPSASAGASTVSAGNAGGISEIRSSVYAGVFALARRLAYGARDNYEVVARVLAFLHRGFTYDTDPPAARYPLVSFLLGNRLGYCQQFSGAMALILRMDGIPARVAAGFTPGTPGSDRGSVNVTAREAHAWVEVLFPGLGWVPFDPTPAAQSGTAPAIAAARHQLSPGQFAADTRLDAGSGSVAGGAPGSRGAARARKRGISAWYAGAALLMLIATAALYLLARRLRSRRRGTDLEPPVGELLRALSVIGIKPDASCTLSELAAELARTHHTTAGRHAARVRDLLYSAEPATWRPSARERKLLRRDLGSGQTPLARLRLLLAVPPRLRVQLGRDRMRLDRR